MDIVREQIRIAAGERLLYSQKKMKYDGAAIECRINAENPKNGFRATPGRITEFIPPGGPGVRVDTHVYSGYQMPSHYDSMIAKLIVHGSNRGEALNILRRALDEFRVEGIKTTIPFHRDLIEHREYASGNYDIYFVDDFVGTD